MLHERSDAEVIFDLRHRGKDRDILIEIAAILRREIPQPDETFLHFLADQIDPRIRDTFTHTKLVLHETKARQKHPKDDVRNFLELHIDIFNEPGVEAVVSFAAYCRHAVSVRDLSTMIARFNPKWLRVDGGIARYEKLVRMRAVESRAMLACARSLRLTSQSRVDPKTAGRARRNGMLPSYYDLQPDEFFDD